MDPIFYSRKYFSTSPSSLTHLLQPITAAPARAASKPAPPAASCQTALSNARRCISYLTIELKDDIPEELRGKMGDWVFGCDVCQQVCPWNRFAGEGDPAFGSDNPLPSLTGELLISKQEFNQRFKRSPVKRAKRRGYLRNSAVALGNTGTMHSLPILQGALNDEEPMVREHAGWAIEEISRRASQQERK